MLPQNEMSIKDRERANLDHDMLIKISTTLENVQKDIADIKSNTSVQLLNHEQRIQNLENTNGIQKWITGTGIVLIGIIITMLISHLFNINL